MLRLVDCFYIKIQQLLHMSTEICSVLLLAQNAGKYVGCDGDKYVCCDGDNYNDCCLLEYGPV
jgi:hypothetical protein